jgi:hypothetical protein
MNVYVQELIKANSQWDSAVSRASRFLESELGPSAGVVTANWSLARDGRGRPLLDLKISDFAGAVNAQFAPDELKNESQVQSRLIRLWGDLLQVRSHKLVEQFRPAGHEAEAN